ncbi:DUF5694 domain-containing protein [Sporosarcina sp. FSL W8-0480]|uniref:DUF5694 domain-containing protein n=1 Tax=Sporosarcina sp. FSL W8-0480 TaxID=2954701 RepID=UPI0030DA2BA6
MTAMRNKPTILLLGTFHMGETADVYVTETDDLFSETRQKEIREVVEQLATFKPTKVAVEVEKKWDAALNEKYDAYIKGDYDLEMNEVFQLGFRIAKKAGLSKVNAIDWMEKGSRRKTSGEVYQWAKENQPKLFQEIFGWLEDGHDLLAIGNRTVKEWFSYANEPEVIKQHHRMNLNIARLKEVEAYVGIDWLVWWYERNLILFSNLMDLATSGDERILFIVGSGHVEIVGNFLRESGAVVIEPVLPYLV